jgi:RNA polymerase sigma-70 factor (ECF subfamily)
MIDWPQIVSAHEAVLWRAAYRILAHRDDALDCCQEALLDAYEYARTRSVNDWPALLTHFVTRRAIDRLRQRSRRQQTFTPLECVGEPAGSIGCPVREAEASELIDRLRQALAGLPQKQAEVWWLSSIEQLSHAAISAHLGITPNESRVLLHRARSQLGLQLDQQSSLNRRIP